VSIVTSVPIVLSEGKVIAWKLESNLIWVENFKIL
jgi:hypothetical protein